MFLAAVIITNSPAASKAAAVVNELRDIKPPIGIPNPWFWIFLILGVLVVIALIVALVLFFVRKRRQVVPPPVIPPHERARRKLEEALNLFDQPKPFCILVSDAVRLYLEERFGLQAPERTTEEFLADLKASPSLDQPKKDSLEQFLSSCDLVKFARYQLGRPELEGLYNSALRLIEETQPKPDETTAEESPIDDRQSLIADPQSTRQ